MLLCRSRAPRQALELDATCRTDSAMPPTARERATLERVRDDLGLAAGLGDEATLAAARDRY